jgi:DMSO/TMAO reductase YedYZ molybdopterin-dependent catalytic subunit
MDENSKLDKIIEARMKLKARFEQQMAQTPSVSDARPMGSGALNRHGMPQLPVGQTKTVKWPVLDLGFKPDVPLSKWKLVVDGEVESPITLSWVDFMALPQTNDVSDFHCVTTWSRMDVPWVGVRLADIAALVMPKPTATHVLCHGYDKYTTNLERDHGGPVRMITPQLYAWKGSKWISRIQFLPKNQLGFWELRGYSNTAYPWRNDRYS